MGMLLMKAPLKILLLGGGEWGKDTVCKAMEERLGIKSIGSSFICLNIVYDRFRELYYETWIEKYNYITVADCWEDRRNQRALWQKFINEYNTPDLTSLTRLIYKDHDIYNGLRNIHEFNAANAAGLFDLIILVDASKRVGLTDPNDFPIPLEAAHWVVDNNGTEEDLARNVNQLCHAIELMASCCAEHGKEIYLTNETRHEIAYHHGIVNPYSTKKQK